MLPLASSQVLSICQILAIENHCNLLEDCFVGILGRVRGPLLGRMERSQIGCPSLFFYAVVEN
jgi:hypothetical protein